MLSSQAYLDTTQLNARKNYKKEEEERNRISSRQDVSPFTTPTKTPTPTRTVTHMKLQSPPTVTPFATSKTNQTKLKHFKLEPRTAQAQETTNTTTKGINRQSPSLSPTPSVPRKEKNTEERPEATQQRPIGTHLDREADRRRGRLPPPIAEPELRRAKAQGPPEETPADGPARARARGDRCNGEKDRSKEREGSGRSERRRWNRRTGER